MLTKQDDATAIVHQWISKHPEILDQLKGRDGAACRELVLELLYPYDRFPSTLNQLIRLALSEVDWSHVSGGSK